MTYHSIIGLDDAEKFMEHHREPPYTLFDPRHPLPAHSFPEYGFLWEECGTDANPRAQLKSNWKVAEGLQFTLSVRAIEADVVSLRGTPPTLAALPDYIVRRGLNHDSALEEGEVDIWTVAVDPAFEDALRVLWNGHSMEGEPEFLVIEGRRYLVFACPVSG